MVMLRLALLQLAGVLLKHLLELLVLHAQLAVLRALFVNLLPQPKLFSLVLVDLLLVIKKPRFQLAEL